MIKIRPGDWARYAGSFPEDEYEWIHISVVAVNGTMVNVSMSYDVRYPYEMGESSNPLQYTRYLWIDVASGSGNTFLYVIPSDLSVGDIIPAPSDYPKLTVEGISLQEYAGVNRTVVYASYSNMPWGGEGTLYWDRATGLLVEIMAQVDDHSFSTLRLIETSMWSMSFTEWLTGNSLSIALIPASVALQLGLLTMLIRKQEINFRVTRPHAGMALLGIGFLLLIVSVMDLRNFNQTPFFSVSFVLGLTFVPVGVLVHSGLWAGTDFKVNIGVVLLALSVPLFGNAFVSAIYREIGALVPRAPLFRQPADIEPVFFYPHAWLVSPIMAAAVSLVIFGIFISLYRFHFVELQ